MKNSSFISDSVFKLSLYYTQKQNKTKQLFFKCLDHNKSEEYFRKELKKIWGEETEYIEEQITIFREELHKEHTSTKLGTITIAGLGITKQLIDKTNQQFIEKKIREYSVRHNSPLLKTDKQEYLKKLVPKYTNDTKGYYSQGKLVRNVSPRTYNSMVYNTTLTRNGWIQTLNDGADLNQELYYIPFHNFSCPYCMQYQEKIMTRDECIRLLGTDNENSEELLHPNCKCVLTFYTNQRMKDVDLVKGAEEYTIRQRMNSLTLKKSEILSDIKIQKYLGNQDSVDKLNTQRNQINKEIREQKSKLDTREKQIQVEAIKRIWR
jgi:hypothetical protein